MGHQHHFLSRLDRVETSHVELALSLYRDHGLLKYLIGHLKLPEGVGRVALSLHDPARGPFLIVTREGTFVTCLGEGMQVGDLPVVPRGQLDAIIDKVSDMRARMEVARTLAGPKGHAHQLLDRIFHAGPELSREEFVAISAFQPLMKLEFLDAFFGSVTELEKLREALLKIDKPKPALKPVLRRYWDLFWAIGHLSVLAFLDSRDLIVSLAEHEGGGYFMESCMAWGGVRQGIFSLALRNFWAVAKVGKLQLAACKADFDAARTQLRLTSSAGSLMAIGLRHSKLRAEARKALAAPKDMTNVLFPKEMLAFFRSCADSLFDDPESALESHRALGAEKVVEMGSRLSEGDPLRFARPEDVPDDLAMTMPLYLRAPILENPEATMLMLLCLPWTARAEPEQLYLPKDHLRLIHDRWLPEDTLQLLSPLRKHYKPPPKKPATAPGPARKGPCPCGSGEKYKRCCGAENNA